MNMQCAFTGCGNKKVCKGMCHGHYKQMRNGEPLKPLQKRIKRGPNCEIQDCGSTHHALGYCFNHYQNFKRNGTPFATVIQIHGATTAERIAAYTRKDGECIRWTRYLNDDGYAQIRDRGSMRSVHTVVFELHNGKVPDGLEIDHLCHNRDCVNIHHLRAVTHKQNMENRAGLRSTNSTGFTGVFVHGSVFQASVVHNGKRVNAGIFDNALAASDAALELRNRLFTHNEIDRTHPENQ